MALNESKREEKILEELRLRMKGHMKKELFEDDHFLLRFLRARNYNLNATEDMLKKHIKWRKKHNVDTILTDYIPHKFLMSDYISISRLGQDRGGSFIIYIHVGHMDFKGLLKTVSYPEIHQYVVHFLEQDQNGMKKIREETGQLVEKSFFIFNFEGFSLSAATSKNVLEFYLKLVSMYEANFPEVLKRAYAINSSYYFFLVWRFIKPFLSEATVNKIKIMGKNDWQEELLECVSPEVLPAFLGGKRTDPNGNPLCKSIVRYGGVIPESYYDYANQGCEARIPDGKKLIVARRSKAEVTLHVLYPGSSLEWEFVVRSRDIGFSVLFKDAEGEDVVVIPWQRIDTAQALESGIYQCEKMGKYVIEFDNTYSWLHEKEIHYTTAIVKPQIPDP